MSLVGGAAGDVPAGTGQKPKPAVQVARLPMPQHGRALTHSAAASGLLAHAVSGIRHCVSDAF